MTTLAGIRFLNKGEVKMPKENYLRIIKGYDPIEPAGFFEKVFYLLWLPVSVFRILLIRIKPYHTKDNNDN